MNVSNYYYVPFDSIRLYLRIVIRKMETKICSVRLRTLNGSIFANLTNNNYC